MGILRSRGASIKSIVLVAFTVICNLTLRFKAKFEYRHNGWNLVAGRVLSCVGNLGGRVNESNHFFGLMVLVIAGGLVLLVVH